MVESRTVVGRISATGRPRPATMLGSSFSNRSPPGWQRRRPGVVEALPLSIDRLILGTETESIDKDYGTLYKATLNVDSSPARRAEIAHRRLPARVGRPPHGADGWGPGEDLDLPGRPGRLYPGR